MPTWRACRSWRGDATVALSPAFAADQTVYTANVRYSVESPLPSMATPEPRERRRLQVMLTLRRVAVNRDRRRLILRL